MVWQSSYSETNYTEDLECCGEHATCDSKDSTGAKAVSSSCGAAESGSQCPMADNFMQQLQSLIAAAVAPLQREISAIKEAVDQDVEDLAEAEEEEEEEE